MAHLTDLEELLAKVPDVKTRDYMRESMSCYMAGAYRGSLVLSYIALFDDLLLKLGELSNVNAVAKKIYKEASKKKADQDVFESFLIEQLASNSLISGLDASFLATLRTLRNKSAHPSGHRPSAEEARFVFFETISRFLSQSILSTTHLVDDLVSRMSNTNFFPSIQISDIKSVVRDEVVNLHDEAMPQLVSKLVAAIVSADIAAEKNARFFLVGLAGVDKEASNNALRSRLITAKADNADYCDVVLQVLSANGGLYNMLNSATVARVHAIILNAIGEAKGSLSESSLSHPTFAIGSISSAMPEKEFVSAFSHVIEALFEKRTRSEFIVRLVERMPSLLDVYFSILLAKAQSSDFGTANSISSALGSLDKPLSAIVSNEQAFQLLAAVSKAAAWGAWDAKGLANSRFGATPLLRAMALEYVSSDNAGAAVHLGELLPSSPSVSDFVTNHLTDSED